jgi:NAD-dependent deacetylase
MHGDAGGQVELATAWREAARTVVLTGAGLSTASGIPDFRSPGGRWERFQPVPLQDFLTSVKARESYWGYKGETWEVMHQAEPNPAHLALADIGRAGRIELLVTQNVDGLHERSGFPDGRLVNIHGSDAVVYCLDCEEGFSRDVVQRRWEDGERVPLCSCGGLLKPGTISFGQSLVAEDLERAFRSAENCDLFLAIGTSLVVSPINQMFEIARCAGARTAIVTAGETPYDGDCDFRFEDPVQRLLPELREKVLEIAV